MVHSVSVDGRNLEVSLSNGHSAQELLEALVPRVRLTRFEVKQPSLTEIFIHLVGQCHA